MIGFPQELGKNDRLSFRQRASQGNRLEKFSLVTQQVFQATQLEIKIRVAAFNEVDGNQAGFQGVTPGEDASWSKSGEPIINLIEHLNKEWLRSPSVIP
jgi:hypothetical protein